jgi:hypothetical protein
MSHFAAPEGRIFADQLISNYLAQVETPYHPDNQLQQIGHSLFHDFVRGQLSFQTYEHSANMGVLSWIESACTILAAILVSVQSNDTLTLHPRLHLDRPAHGGASIMNTVPIDCFIIFLFKNVR